MLYRLYLAPLLPEVMRGRHNEPVAGNALHLRISVQAGEGFHDCHFPQSRRTLCLCWARLETHQAIDTDPSIIALSPLANSEAEYAAWLDAGAEVSATVVSSLALLGIVISSKRGAGLLAQLRTESFIEQRQRNHLVTGRPIVVANDLTFAGKRI